MNEKKIFKELEAGGLFNYLHRILYGDDDVKYEYEADVDYYKSPSYVRRRRGSFTREEAQAKALMYRNHLMTIHKRMQAELLQKRKRR